MLSVFRLTLFEVQLNTFLYHIKLLKAQWTWYIEMQRNSANVTPMDA